MLDETEYPELLIYVAAYYPDNWLLRKPAIVVPLWTAHYSEMEYKRAKDYAWRENLKPANGWHKVYYTLDEGNEAKNRDKVRKLFLEEIKNEQC